MPGANVLSDELLRLVRAEVLRSKASFEPRPQRGRRPRRGGGTTTGGEVVRAIVRATSLIPAGTGTGASRSPGSSSDYVVVKGDVSGAIKNWSLVEITIDSFMVIVEIDGDNIIVSAFC